MMWQRIVPVLILCLLAIGTGNANAQEARQWADIDCAQSKIVAPPGLKCRSTQLYAGSDSKVAGAGAGGQFQRWAAFGTAADGNPVFYYASEAVDAQSWTRPNATLEEVVRGFSRAYKSSRNFTELAQVNGGDFQRFTNPKGQACFAIRKLGSARSVGYRWLLVAGKCSVNGSAFSEADVADFLKSTDFRS